ncbi:MAG: 1,4-alpha-glucan branching protein GlgB [Gammaproteobacteria bacterium]|nr:MAG: 1,4-alpha-glucan branching protein GlgB [Gammaproteobacteria bacterium]
MAPRQKPGKTPRQPGDGLQRIIEARHHDPFSVLGRHTKGKKALVRAYLPYARGACIGDGGPDLEPTNDAGIFEWAGPAKSIPRHYLLDWVDHDGQAHSGYDPYSFDQQISDYDLHLFGEGNHWHAWRFLGANHRQVDGIDGVLFATWAPNAERVSVVGNFNRWDGRCHPMCTRGASGLWELFIPGPMPGSHYKFEIRQRDTGVLRLKSDPYAQWCELRPATASRIPASKPYTWDDKAWLEARADSDWLHQPLSVYEIHLGSWRHGADGEFCDYRTLAHELATYVQDLGFTHIELLPIMEHPFDASWGYQTTGYFAPTSRFGTPDDFKYFVDYLHQQGIGVLLDWTPAHFPKDDFALARFDGSTLYEHEDPRRGEHPDWGTLIFNYGRNEVKNFLLSNALFWLEEMHLDGLRVDAVASMLYLDYSRKAHDWIPNPYGGRENLEAIAFLRQLNVVAHASHPGAVIIAEESTAWPQVSRPVDSGGLGFSMKWNMGWMHDTLEYMKRDSVHKSWHHDRLSFGMLYAWTENFVLPLSHDEVVHGKRSLLDKMPGDEWQRFANLRLLFTYQWTYPGKKLLFMGSEFAQGLEWNSESALEWHLLDYPHHRGMQTLIRDLNRIYRELPALHIHDFESQGFEWLDCNDAQHSILTFIRRHGTAVCVIALNFTPVPHNTMRLGVPQAGKYRVVLNSDSGYYGGSNYNSGDKFIAKEIPAMERPYSIEISLPPLAGLIILHEND